MSLLKIYNDFGPEFFTFKVHQDAYDFWMTDIPQIWKTSPMIQKALYAITSVKMQSKYDLSSIETVSISKEGDFLHSKRPLACQDHVKLFDEANRYFRETSKLIDESIEILHNCKDGDKIPDLVGQILVGKTIQLSCLSLFPSLPKKAKGSKDITTCGVFSVMKFMYTLTNFASGYIKIIMSTKYEKMLSLSEQFISIKTPNEFPFINYLRDYVKEF